MKNKKGFTFIELLAVIALIGVLVIIAIPTLLTVKNRINERLANTKKELLLSAAELYAQDNGKNSNLTVTVRQLIDSNYIEADIKSGEDDCTNENGCIVDPYVEVILDDVEILVEYSNKTYTAKVTAWPEKE